jgi:hypothetical protein
LWVMGLGPGSCAKGAMVQVCSLQGC